jgi:hypothetical protein
MPYLGIGLIPTCKISKRSIDFTSFINIVFLALSRLRGHNSPYAR